MAKQRNMRKVIKRYGVAELFGEAVSELEPEELRRLTRLGHASQCPFRKKGAHCNKKGGVCSLVVYEKDETETVRIVGTPVTTCPNRFLEGDTVFQWVGETLIANPNPSVISEVSFLMSENKEETGGEDEVGRIDNVLVNPDNYRNWCALEMQAVYFSGPRMADDFSVMQKWSGPGIPFPTKLRRPDYRSSGPKRLMPQLQTKVPTLRRWGKKMAVVVDRSFWESLGEMRSAKHISKADILWFVVSYRGPTEGRYHLMCDEMVLATLEHAVEGLTGGTPVSLDQFESAILRKLGRS